MLIAGNWKMHTGRAEAVALAEAAARLAAEVGPAVEVAVCPPFVWLEAVAGVLVGSAARLGAQNVHAEASGAFTGEVAAPMLVEAGCRYVIVGHSERRQLLGEADADVAAKLRRALHHALVPILCVGETLAERDAGREEAVVLRQLDAALAGAEPAREALVVAYEPVWAIGTGRTATPAQAQAMHRLVRERLGAAPGGADVRLLYGGSVKADNAAELFAEPDVDGALVGGASLDAAAFAAIARAAAAR
jgi:triosephosphate isomerase